MMTLDEAIQHSIEVAKSSDTCIECAEQHKQLARWLIKLKIYELKEQNKSYPIYPINELGMKKHSCR